MFIHLKNRILQLQFCRFFRLVSALVAAAPYLQFLGDDGRFYSLADVFHDIGAFLKTDDSIFPMVTPRFFWTKFPHGTNAEKENLEKILHLGKQ